VTASIGTVHREADIHLQSARPSPATWQTPAKSNPGADCAGATDLNAPQPEFAKASPW